MIFTPSADITCYVPFNCCKGALNALAMVTLIA